MSDDPVQTNVYVREMAALMARLVKVENLLDEITKEDLPELRARCSNLEEDVNEISKQEDRKVP